MYRLYGCSGSLRPSCEHPAQGPGRPLVRLARSRHGLAVAPVKVLAVDDQEVFLQVARELIAAAKGFEQVGEASSGAEGIKLAVELRPDLVLVDVRMPGMDGVETMRRIR